MTAGQFHINGEIFVDRNGTKIATSERVYNVILDVVVMTDKEEYIDPTIKVLNRMFRNQMKRQYERL